MWYYPLSGLINGITLTVLGLLVFLKNRRGLPNRTYAVFCFFISFWSYSYFLWQISKTNTDALFWCQMLMVGAVFIPASYFHFVTILIGKYPNKKMRRVIYFAYLLALVFVILNFTPLMIKDVRPRLKFPFWPTAGPVYKYFLIYFVGYAIYGCYLLLREAKYASGPKRNQLTYIFVGSMLGYLGGSTNFPLWYDIKLYPAGNILSSVYVGLVGYAIYKYRLMDIRIALTRAWIFAVVYTLVLGLPFVVIKWLKPVLIPLLGENWWIAILVFGMALASAGPFIYLFLQRRAEAIILKDQRRYQQALRELSKTMTRFRDIDKLLQAIDLTVIEQVKVSFAAIYLKDAEYNSFKRKHYFPPKEKDRFPEFIPLDSDLIKILYQYRRPLLSEEIGHQDKINLDSGLVIPCFIENQLLGFMVLGAKPNNQMYTQDDLIVFETLSYSTALAIENSQFWKEIEERQRQARMAEMDLFSYSVAHEIDNPMSIIKVGIELLSKFFIHELNIPEEKKMEFEKIIARMSEAQERTSGMIKAVEEFGKKTAGEFGPLRLEDVLKSYFELYLPQFKYHGIFFSKEIPERIPFLRGSKQELMQVLVNLSNNSIHALLGVPQGQEKRIQLKIELPNSDWVRISFSDNGYGITQEKLQAIFVAFTTTKASTEGRGMGLYAVRKVIERHSGRVWAESEGKGKGATFIIELPIAKDVTEEDFKKEGTGRRIF